MSEGAVRVALSEATAEMERGIACLAVEVPGEVWTDVRDRWHAVRDQIGPLCAAADALAEAAERMRVSSILVNRDNLRIVATFDTTAVDEFTDALAHYSEVTNLAHTLGASHVEHHDSHAAAVRAGMKRQSPDPPAWRFYWPRAQR